MQQCHEPADVPLWNHIRKEIVNDRADNQVEDVVENDQSSENPQIEGIAVPDEAVFQQPADRFHPPDADECERHEWRCEQKKRHAPTELCAGPVAAETHNRRDDHVEHIGNRRAKKRDQLIVRAIIPGDERQSVAEHHLHHGEDPGPEAENRHGRDQPRQSVLQRAGAQLRCTGSGRRTISEKSFGENDILGLFAHGCVSKVKKNRERHSLFPGRWRGGFNRSTVRLLLRRRRIPSDFRQDAEPVHNVIAVSNPRAE